MAGQGSPADLSDLQLAELLVGRLRERERSADLLVAPSGAIVLPDPTPKRIDQIREATNCALIVTGRGLLLFGLTPEGREAVLAIDTAAAEIGIQTATVSVSRKLGDTCPAISSLAELAAGVMGRTAEAVAAGEHPTAAPAGRHERLGLTIQASHPEDGLARVTLGEAALCCHSLQLVALAAELFALQGRLVADQLALRAGLEEALAQPASRQETPLLWERSHGS